MKFPKINAEQAGEILDACYDKALKGLPGSNTCYQLAEEYMSKYPDKESAIKAFVNFQIAKCTTSGFLTSLGGLITLPVAIPANLVSVWYVQLRMVATIAVMCDYEPSDDAVQTLAYICLTGSSASKILKEAGINMTNKLAFAFIKKIPGETLKAINKKIGFRFITKAGEKGIVNLSKLVPLVGGLFGAGLDFSGTRIIAKSAKKVFLENKID